MVGWGEGLDIVTDYLNKKPDAERLPQFRDANRPALERAFASGKPAIVNVKTDYRARATTMRFTNYMT